MAKNQANSNQIKEKAILGRHIGLGEVDGTHLKDAAIIESKHIALGAITDDHLSIDWTAKASTILQSKLVVDYVQAQPVTVNANATTVKVTSAISASVATDTTTKGVVVETGKNQVIVRTAADVTEPIRDTDGEEVKGHVTHDGTDFIIDFYTVKAGSEVPFEFNAEASIVFQYPQRFDFETVSEFFGANEKFVDYGIDTSVRFDITQLVADIFGGTYALTGDGLAANAETLVSQVSTHTSEILAVEASIADAVTKVDEVLVIASTAEAAGVDNSYKIGLIQTAIDGHTTGIEGLAVANADLTSRIETLETVEVTSAQRHDKLIDAGDLTTSAVVFAIDAAVGKEPKAGDYDVYLNGMLQMNGHHYSDSAVDGEKVKSITFAPDALVAGDVVQIRWFA